MDYTDRFLVKFCVDMHYNIFKCQCKIVDNIEKTKKFCTAVVGADGAELGSRSALEGRRLLACLHRAWLARRLASGRVSTLLSNCVRTLFGPTKSERNSTTKSKHGPMRASVRATRDVNKPAAASPLAPSGCRALRRRPPPPPYRIF
uniref:Uncharacterized protein n=2 Tax=Trichogramma kaykai TaxID=54128 RepID=A0ABD2VXF3_9HYME